MKKFIPFVMAAAFVLPSAVSAWNVPDETLHYTIHYKWGFLDADAGVATLSTRTFPDSGTFQATLTGQSVNMLGHVYAAGDTIRGTIMSDSIRSVYTEHLSHESGEFAIETYTYDKSGSSSDGQIIKRLPGGQVVRSRISHYGGGVTLDLLGVFYYMRQIDYGQMNVGDKVTVNVLAGEAPETLDITYNGGTQVSINGKPRDAYSISLTFTAVGNGKTTSDNLEALISTDDTRIPLQVKGNMKFGHILCTYLDSVAAVQKDTI